LVEIEISFARNLKYLGFKRKRKRAQQRLRKKESPLVFKKKDFSLKKISTL